MTCHRLSPDQTCADIGLSTRQGLATLCHHVCDNPKNGPALGLELQSDSNLGGTARAAGLPF
jgi:hypothetical protein